MITGIYEFGFFCPKMAVSWRITVFQKLVCWNPYFYSVLGVRVFWAKFSKKGIFGHPQKIRYFWLIAAKLIFFDMFFVFFVLFYFFCCFCCFGFFFGGFKGQVRWPEGPPHLALNPPYCFFLFCFFVFVFFVFFVFCFFFCFFSLLLSEKTVFPLKKGNFCLLLSVSLCFSWAFFGLPLVQFLFLWLSLSISLSLSLFLVLFFLSSFLSFFFAFFWFLLFSLFLSFSVFFGFVLEN